MVLAQWIGWFGALTVIVSYFISVKACDPMIFHMGNVLGGLLLVPTQVYLGVWFGAFLSGMFTIIAMYAIWKEKM